MSSGPFVTEGCFFAAVEAVGPGADGQALQGDRVHAEASCAGAASPPQETADCHRGTQQSKGVHTIRNENIYIRTYIQYVCIYVTGLVLSNSMDFGIIAMVKYYSRVIGTLGHIVMVRKDIILSPNPGTMDSHQVLPSNVQLECFAKAVGENDPSSTA